MFAVYLKEVSLSMFSQTSGAVKDYEMIKYEAVIQQSIFSASWLCK